MTDADPQPPPRPFRWTLSSHAGARPDRLGALLDGTEDIRPGRWFIGELTANEEAARPVHHKDLGEALAVARALVEEGRSRPVREELVRLMAREPGFAGREQRRLALALRSGLRKRRPRPRVGS
ncbi:hypothetical protein [Streptomyces sp. NPDC005408]|uniref:hypothetical protein n=1 Tax=Streptomyces sp. NPDC005408 TaxID=3155341 RepID=UPI0033BA6204